MTVQPLYHWQFNEGQGVVATDTVSGIKADFSNIAWDGHGRIGNAIKIDGRNDNSRVEFGNVVGQFGTSDFTVAFGIKVLGTYGQKDLDVFGNRLVMGHGNWFSIRMKNDGRLTFEVDENEKGKNYAFVDSKQPLKDGKWHHVTAVREGRTLKLYIDGVLSVEGKSKTGIANIKNGSMLRLGRSRRKSAIAQYEDILIYHTALSAEEVSELIPPENRPLRAGEIELVATDDAAIILRQDVENLSRLSPNFNKLRVGQNTGVTLYQGDHFGGKAQKSYADIPDIRLSRVADFPQSIRIWSAVGQPFTGKWIIKAPNGQFLSLGESSLTTETSRSNNALFNFHYNLHYGQPQLIPGSDQESTFVNVAPGADPAYLFVDDSEGHKDAFSLTNTANDQWLQLSNDKTFRWTTNREDRAVFMRVVKIADNEGQVGELSPGEVALYEHYAYWGRTWILSDTGNDVAGNYTNFIDFQDLNDRISSIRLGPDTGVTLFKHVNYHVTNGNRENEIEDIVENVPSLQESQVGNDAISSVKIFKTVEPEGVLDSYTSKLSQDYRTTDNGLEEFSAYRTILKFSPDVGEVEVSATDLTQIEVEGIPYEIDEVRSVTLTPNAINRIMITSEADGLNTPGLKIRTSTMAANERVVIFPNKEAHQQIAELEGDALWNAKDAKGNLIVDRQAHSREEVASVQSTIKRTMATVAYAADAPVGRSRARSSVPSVDRVIDSRTIDNPWRLQFKAATGSNGSKRTVPGKGRIREEAISQDDLMQLLNQANRNGLGRARRGLISKIKDAVKKAVSVVVGVVKNVVHIIVETAKEVINFVIDTAEKVGEFVEAVVEKVVNGIKQFIEFLQFLFNWDDILETQRYLVRAFNSGLDSATQLAEAAKPRVSAFVDNLQDSVEDGLNVLVEKLGGEPSEVRTSGFELPEAFEWFLSKLLGGSQQEGANVSPRSSGNSEIDTFFSHFIEAFEDAVGAGLRVSEGLIESIQALIANPRQPELALVALIEALRDAIIQSLDAVENVALGLLDVISRVIQLVRNVLNAEIRIPFISDLFALIGAGKLTILNVSSLLLAIPVTLISKLVTNRKPFTAAALPFDVSSRGRLALAQSTEEQTDSPETISDLRRNLLYTTIGATADTVNHIINGVLDFADKPKPGPDSSAASVSSSASATKALPKFSKLFEWTSVFLSGLSLVVSKPSDLDADFDVISKEEKREIILWNVRATALGVDLAGVLAGEQRLRRLNAFTSIGWAIYNVADLVLFSMYLAAVEEDNQAIKNSTIISEVFSWLPNFVCIVRGLPLGEPLGTIAHVGHAVTNGAAAVATLATGIVLIIQDNKALEAALDAAKVTA